MGRVFFMQRVSTADRGGRGEGEKRREKEKKRGACWER
jgi:hypothetical protein